MAVMRRSLVRSQAGARLVSQPPAPGVSAAADDPISVRLGGRSVRVKGHWPKIYLQGSGRLTDVQRAGKNPTRSSMLPITIAVFAKYVERA